MTIGDRLRKLDDNPASRGVLWLSDHFGWWWNLGLGGVVVVAGVLYLVDGRSDEGYPLLGMGTAGLLVGLAIRAGRRRRRHER